jgi:hypothetical protein
MTRARVKALHDKVTSLLATLDLGTPLDGMLPHADVLCVIRYKAHQDTGEEDKPWPREGEEPEVMKVDTKLDPTSREALEGREDAGRSRTRSDRTHNRAARSQTRSTGRQPDFPQARTGHQPDGNLRGFRLATGRPDPGPDHPVTGPV